MTKTPDRSSAGPPRRATVLVVGSITAAFILSQFFRTATAVIAPDLAREANLSPEMLGLLTGAFFIAIAVMQLPVGVLLDRYGPRRVTPTLLCLAVAGALLFSVAETPAVFVLGQAMIGAGCAGVFVGGLVTFSRWFPPARFVVVSALMMSLSNIGTMASATPFAAVVEWIGWRGGYQVAAAAAACLALLVFAMVRDAPPGHPFHSRRPERLRDVVRGFREVAGNRAVWGVLVMAFAAYASMISVRGLWGGPFLADVYGLDGIARGNVLLAMSVAITVGALTCGILDYRGVRRRRIVLTNVLVKVVCFALLAFAPMPDALTAAVVFVIIGLFGSYSVLLLAQASALFPDRLVGRAITTANLANFTGASLMLIVPGWILGAFPEQAGHPPERAYGTVFATLGLLLAIAATVYARARPRPRAASAGSAAGEP